MTTKARQRWLVTVTSFILLSMLTLTGLINWLLHPKGRGAGGGFATGARHFFTGLHEWTALLFLVAIGVHIGLHWSYVKSNLKGMSRAQ